VEYLSRGEVSSSSSQTPQLIEEEALFQICKSLEREKMCSWVPVEHDSKKYTSSDDQQQFTGLDSYKEEKDKTERAKKYNKTCNTLTDVTFNLMSFHYIDELQITHPAKCFKITKCDGI
jgi:hypothetical protein